MKTYRNKMIFAKILQVFCILRRKKNYPFLQGWEFLQREELEQDNGPGQKVSQEKEADCQFMVYMLPQCCLATPSIADFMVASQGFYLVDFD